MTVVSDYLMVNEGFGVESVYNSEKILSGHFYDYYNVLPKLVDSNNQKKVLIVGLSGGTIARQLNYFHKDKIEIDGVEIDPRIIDVAKKYFKIGDTGVNIYNLDGRMFLKNNEKKYDLIIIDAYTQEFYVPWTLTTKEFWSLVENNLTPNGLMAMNLNSATHDSLLLKAVSNTIAKVFPNSYSTPIKNGEMNYILTGSKKPIDLNKLADLYDDKELGGLARAYKKDTEKVLFDSDGVVLTDDRAPIEFLTDSMLSDYFNKQK